MKKWIIVANVLPWILVAKPVHVGDVLTHRGHFKLDLSTSYTNMQRTSGVSAPIVYPTEWGDSVTVPTYVGDFSTTQDYLNYNMTLRYGLTEKLEIFGSGNAYWSHTHSDVAGTFTAKSSKGINALSVGGSYQIKNEDQTPSLLVGISANILEKVSFKSSQKTMHLKSYRLFATTYYTVDPIVFALKASYRINRKRSSGKESMEGGNALSLTPQIYFAVNPSTSLHGGVRYTHIGAIKADGKKEANPNSQISYLGGVSYELSRKTTISVDTEYTSGASAQSKVAASLSYAF